MVMVKLLVVAAVFVVIEAVWLKLINPFYRGRT
jgi:predicted outer membrane lipoprotein